MTNRNFLKNQRGATAIIWAIMLMPLLALIAAALDFSSRETVQRQVKAATDMAAIAAVRLAIEQDVDEDELKQAAIDNFNQNMASFPQGSLVTPYVEIDEINGITVWAEYNMPTTMLGIAGVESLKVKARSRAGYSSPAKIEAVLVLDNSFSMDGARMTQLRDAADEFLNLVLKDASGDVKVGLVPFNHYVNVGTDNEGEGWIDVASAYSETLTFCSTDVAASEANGCYVNPSCSSDYSCSDMICPDSTDLVQSCTTEDTAFEWFGCVESRPPPLDIEDEDYGIEQEVGRMNYTDWGCPAKILPLTSDRSKVDLRLDEMEPEADTYIAPGISWGYKVLSSQAPFTEGANETAFKNEGGRKIMIIMSDGENTRSRNDWGTGSDHWGDDVDDANDRTRAACEYVKSMDVEVFTISFGVTDADTIEILSDCASDIDQFYNTMDASALMSAFKNIGKSFRDVALVE